MTFLNDLGTNDRTDTMYFLARKINVIPVYTLKAYRGRRGTPLLILNQGSRWRSVVNLMSWIPNQGERTLIHTKQEAGVGPRANLDCLGEEKPLAHTGI